MADGISIRTNLPDFKKALSAFSADFERRVIRSATNAAAQQFKRIVVARAPILRTPSSRAEAGRLKRAIYVYRIRSPKGIERYSVSFRKGRAAQTHKRLGNVDAYYGRFLELGWIPRGRGKRLRGGTRGKALARSRASAQRITKYKFIAPAFAQAQAAALNAFRGKIEARVAKGV